MMIDMSKISLRAAGLGLVLTTLFGGCANADEQVADCVFTHGGNREVLRDYTQKQCEAVFTKHATGCLKSDHKDQNCLNWSVKWIYTSSSGARNMKEDNTETRRARAQRIIKEQCAKDPEIAMVFCQEMRQKP